MADHFESDEIDCDQLDPSALRESTVVHLTRAVEAAAKRLQRAAEGERFPDDGQARSLVAILKMAPKLLPLLKPAEQPRKLVPHPFFDHDIPEDQVPDLKPAPPPLIPPCSICGAGYGSHWPNQCPKNPDRKYSTPTPIDRQVVKEILRRYGMTDPTCESDVPKEEDHA